MKNDTRCVELVFGNNECLTIHETDFDTINKAMNYAYNYTSMEKISSNYFNTYFRAVISWNKVCYARELICEDHPQEEEKNGKKKK